jgi:uncharacterized protein YggL (DUF469 family)
MSDTLKIAGCKKISDQILEYLNSLVLAAMSNDYAKSKQFAGKIVYDANHLKEFLPSDKYPKWLTDVIDICDKFSKLGNLNAPDYAKHVVLINDILFDLKNFSWDQSEVVSSYIDLDAEFAKNAAAGRLDEAIDKLIDCLNIIANEPAFKLNRQTKYDIQTLINNLRRSKNSSESTIKSWLITAGELVKLFIPHIDKVETTIKLLKKTEDAFNEVYRIIDCARYSVSQKLINEFCLGEKFVLKLDETTKIQLAIPESIEAEQPVNETSGQDEAKI